MKTIKFKKVLLSGMLGTSGMTVFSYVASELMSENFREPEIMCFLFKNLLVNPQQYEPYLILLAWSVHYVIGFIFVLIYVKLWDNNTLKSNLVSGIFLGAICGVVGIIGWYFTLKIHPNPPSLNLKNFFIILFFAHIVFGIFAMIGYRLVKKSE
jgi:hypothetical protein